MVSSTQSGSEGRERLKRSCSVDLSFPYHRYEQSHEGEAHATVSLPIDCTRDLETNLSELFEFESALWFPSGTMAQLVAARIFMQATEGSRAALHPTSHLLLHEAEAYRHILGLEAVEMGSWNRTVLASDLPDSAAFAFLELPQRHNGGALPTWDELQAIKRATSGVGKPLHIDGARIWGCRPFYDNRTYAEIVHGCSSLYVSLYKDLGASSGAALMGSREFIDQACIWRVRHGGALVNSEPQAADALRGLRYHLPQMERYVEVAHQLAQAIVAQNGCVTSPHPPHVNMFRVPLPFGVDQARSRRDAIAASHKVWLSDNFWQAPNSTNCELEITVGEIASQTDPDVIANAISALIGIR
ncbi:threonine aldolase family protein [Erythrobacter ani]|uniref:Aromatic amino acid beta-eliminating lyase/threonine aldolase domain-containing protein n=1 Tax=Erythrobacter ani TaxID=2827235 RepID=A0ABS6SLZ4_9SPHN|nr:beta-eliminating lyase-related protein [Erythrobacter ani]MBV7266074.1 hypothetical protein [Erythrobacter ani]